MTKIYLYRCSGWTVLLHCCTQYVEICMWLCEDYFSIIYWLFVIYLWPDQNIPCVCSVQKLMMCNEGNKDYIMMRHLLSSVALSALIVQGCDVTGEANTIQKNRPTRTGCVQRREKVWGIWKCWTMGVCDVDVIRFAIEENGQKLIDTLPVLVL